MMALGLGLHVYTHFYESVDFRLFVYLPSSDRKVKMVLYVIVFTIQACGRGRMKVVVKCDLLYQVQEDCTIPKNWIDGRRNVCQYDCSAIQTSTVGTIHLSPLKVSNMVHHEISSFLGL